MPTSSRPLKTPSLLSDSVWHRLNKYALAASASGVSLLALSQPSEAKIIYTKAHQDIGFNGVYGVDLNHDGTIDFVIRNWSSFSGIPLSAKEAFGNAVEGSGHSAAALIKGLPINSRQQFIVAASSYAGERMVTVACTVEGGCNTSGPWVNVKAGYLGLKFLIEGKTHYGWARLSVAVQNNTITATLTGFAYETMANKGIRAGQTSGEADATPTQPDGTRSGRDPAISAAPASGSTQAAFLAQLALGAQSASFRRRP
jgi:hypothetical protein